MADNDNKNEYNSSEKNDFGSVIKNNPLPALSLSFTITLASIGLLYTIFNSWNNSLAGIIILIIILLILPMALTIGVLLIILNTRAYERFKQKIAPVVVIYIILLLVCVSLAYVCVPKSENSSANPSVVPTGKVTLNPTQTPAQNPTTAPADNSANSGKATIILKNGGTIKNATVEFGPRGWDSYVSGSFEYTDDLTVIAQATYGPRSGRFLQLANVKKIDFVGMNDEEQKIINENSTYRDHIRKVKVTYGDGKIVSDIYLIEYAYYDTEAEHGSIQDTPVTAIVY